MANAILTSTLITQEALRVLENNLTFAKMVNREYDAKFGEVIPSKTGTTINVRKPARYVGRSGAALAVEDHTENSVPFQITTQFGVDVNFTTAELTLQLGEFSDRILKPALATIANKIDRDGLALYWDVYNAVGTPGTTPNALLTYLQAGAKMDFEATPRDGLRSLCIEPTAQATIVDALKGLFQSSEKIKNQYEMGNMGLAGGFKWSMDQNVITHTVGPLGGTPLVNGASQTGASLVTDGWTAAAASRLKRGDIFTIAGVNAVNPQTRESTGQLRQFVVTANVSSDAGGNLTAAISPSITTSGAFQTVTGSPADNAAITVLGAASTVSPANMAFHRDAFSLATVDLIMPSGVDFAARVADPQLGISIRMVRAYDINNDKLPCRFDVYYGWKTLYPELACRIQG